MPVRVGALAEPVIYVPKQMRLSEIVQRFVATPQQQVLVVTEEGEPTGLVTRVRALELAVSAKSDQLGVLTAKDMAEDVLQIESQQPAALVAIQQQTDGYAKLQAGALITKNGETIGHLTLSKLLQAVSREATRATDFGTVQTGAYTRSCGRLWSNPNSAVMA